MGSNLFPWNVVLDVLIHILSCPIQGAAAFEYVVSEFGEVNTEIVQALKIFMVSKLNQKLPDRYAKFAGTHVIRNTRISNSRSSCE